MHWLRMMRASFKTGCLKSYEIKKAALLGAAFLRALCNPDAADTILSTAPEI